MIREQRVYELFFTALPALGFTAADVVKLYLHSGGFETALADEDLEQDSDRWSSYTPHGQVVWQILSHWMWNLRRELSQKWQLTSMRLTEFSPLELKPCHSRTPPQQDHPSGLRSGRAEAWEDTTFSHNLTARYGVGKGPRCIHRSDAPNTMGRACALYRSDRRLHLCPFRLPCQGHGTSTKKPRRVSAALHPLPPAVPEEQPPSSLSAPASHPILWGDWSRCQARRAWVRWQRSHLVTVQAAPVPPPSSTPLPFSRAERAHWRMTLPQRLARNARPPTAPPVKIIVYGLSSLFAQTLGLRIA